MKRNFRADAGEMKLAFKFYFVLPVLDHLIQDLIEH